MPKTYPGVQAQLRTVARHPLNLERRIGVEPTKSGFAIRRLADGHSTHKLGGTPGTRTLIYLLKRQQFYSFELTSLKNWWVPRDLNPDCHQGQHSFTDWRNDPYLPDTLNFGLPDGN